MKFKTFFSELRFGQNDNSYFKNFQYSPADEDEREFGELFMAIEILNNPGGAEVAAEEVFAKLQETYYAQLGGDTYTSFETALREVNAALRDLLERSPQKWLGRINAIIAVRANGDLHLAQTGAAEAYLLRAGKLVRVSENISEVNKEAKEQHEGEVNTFLNISSGEIVDLDQLIFATEQLLRVISQDELERIFNRDQGMNFLAALQDKIVLESGQALSLAFVSVATITEKQPSLEQQEQPVINIGDDQLKEQESNLSGSANKFGGLRRPLGSRLSRTAGIGQRISFWLKNDLPNFGEWIRERRLAITEWADGVRQSTDKRTATFALVIMVIVVIVGVMVTYSKNSEQRQIDEFQKTFTELKTQVEKAETRLLYDVPSATKILLGAQQEVEKLLTKGLFTANVEATKKQIQAALDKAQGVQRIILSNNNEIADVASAKVDASPQGLIRYGNSINAFDQDTWYSITLGKVSMQTITTDAKITVGTYFPDQEVTVFLTDDGRLVEWSGTQAEFIKTEDETFHQAIAIGEYSRYLYFLDPENNQIWKYARGTDNYGQAIEYNKNTNLTQATGITIDGDIYISTQDGEIKQLFRSEQTDWFIELPEGVEVDQPRRIRTSLEGKSVFIQDRDDRIMQFVKKNGEYLKQFVFDIGDQKITDFAIDDENMKIFVLVGTKIYVADMVL